MQSTAVKLKFRAVTCHTNKGHLVRSGGGLPMNCEHLGTLFDGQLKAELEATPPTLRFTITWRTAEAKAPTTESVEARRVTLRHETVRVTTPNARTGGTVCRLLAKSRQLRNKLTSDS